MRDEATEGFDVLVDISLKQFRDYGTKWVDIPTPTPAQPKPQATIEPPRPATNPPEPPERKHTVVKGNTLSSIAKQYYGDSKRWTEIHNANKSAIKNPNLIYPGQVFIIP
jgi:nucleoid-associated protein YgaU